MKSLWKYLSRKYLGEFLDGVFSENYDKLVEAIKKQGVPQPAAEIAVHQVWNFLRDKTKKV